jgi:hypothetical protein
MRSDAPITPLKRVMSARTKSMMLLRINNIRSTGIVIGVGVPGVGVGVPGVGVGVTPANSCE